MGSVFSRVRRGASYDLVRVVLGLILLLAAGLKAPQLATDPLATLAPRPSSLAPFLHSRPFLIGVVECELLFGLVLLSGIFPGKGDRHLLCEAPNGTASGATGLSNNNSPLPAAGEGQGVRGRGAAKTRFSEPRVTWALSLLCFGGFALVSLYKGISGDATCGCFGRVPVNPWYTFALDAAAVLALLRWRPRGESPFHLRPFARPAAVLALWLLVGTPVALATWSEPASTLTDLGEVLDGGRIVILKPETWVGRDFPLLDHVQIHGNLARGRWMVLFYRADCRHCGREIEFYRRVGDSLMAAGTCVALIEVPSFGALTQEAGGFPRYWSLGFLSRPVSWMIDTPLVLSLDNGVVVARVPLQSG